MLEEIKHGAGCAEFEALVTEALDGQLSGARKESFEAHRRTCALCGPMFADAQAGQVWMKSLAAVEPPPHLVHNILAATSGVMSTRLAESGATGRALSFGERAREWWDSWFVPTAAFVRQPRFAMSFGMVFFSFSLLANLAGVKPADLAKIDLHPSAIRHAYTEAQIRVVKYYDNIRFVYEIESRVRELKRATTPAEPGPQEKKENRNNDNTSEQPRNQDRNYSRDTHDTVLAQLKEQNNSMCAKAASGRESRAMSELVRTHGAQLGTRSYRRFV